MAYMVQIKQPGLGSLLGPIGSAEAGSTAALAASSTIIPRALRQLPLVKEHKPFLVCDKVCLALCCSTRPEKHAGDDLAAAAEA